MLDDEKRLTKWKPATEKMAGGTQFGPCNFGQWCEFMATNLRKIGRTILIETNDRGEVAMYEEIRTTSD